MKVPKLICQSKKNKKILVARPKGDFSKLSHVAKVKHFEKILGEELCRQNWAQAVREPNHRLEGHVADVGLKVPAPPAGTSPTTGSSPSGRSQRVRLPGQGNVVRGGDHDHITVARNPADLALQHVLIDVVLAVNNQSDTGCVACSSCSRAIFECEYFPLIESFFGSGLDKRICLRYVKLLNS